MLIGDIYHKHAKTISGRASVKDAVWELLKDEINGAVVVDDKHKVIGIISLQDIAGATVPAEFRKNIAMAVAMYKKGFFQENCEAIANMPVTEVMRRDFLTVDLQTNIMAVTVDFLKNDLYIVPVIENGKLIGVVTRTEIKKAIAEKMGVLKDTSDE